MSQDFFTILSERGFIDNCTNEAGLQETMESSVISAYIGFDCTASSLHVGSLVQIMMLRHLQNCGHKPIVLLGGGTTKIGDPSGKDKARQMLTEQQISENKKSIEQIFKKFLRFDDSATSAIIIDNEDWLSEINYLEFLRDYGKYFSINRMLTFESVKNRLEREQNLSFLEFNYMLLQAFDFAELCKRYKCRLQMGGSDQWGNIVSGIDLARRLDLPELFGLTAPLITTSSGTKMGKSEKGAIWLNADLLSPYDYWQFWRNVDDRDVGRFLRLFTELELNEINKLENLEGQEINQAKIVLANEATTMCHSKEEAVKAEETAQKTFSEGQSGDDLPRIKLTNAVGMPIFKALVDTKLADSNGAARRLITGGGIKINNEKCADTNYELQATDFVDNELKLSAGKKRHVIVEL